LVVNDTWPIDIEFHELFDKSFSDISINDIGPSGTTPCDTSPSGIGLSNTTPSAIRPSDISFSGINLSDTSLNGISPSYTSPSGIGPTSIHDTNKYFSGIHVNDT
jgi:hypothetical protein